MIGVPKSYGPDEHHFTTDHSNFNSESERREDTSSSESYETTSGYVPQVTSAYHTPHSHPNRHTYGEQMIVDHSMQVPLIASTSNDWRSPSSPQFYQDLVDNDGYIMTDSNSDNLFDGILNSDYFWKKKK